MRKIVNKFTVLLVLLGLSACGQEEVKPSIDEIKSGIKKGIKKTIQGANQAIDQIAPQGKELQDSASDEVQKLFTFEYKVIELQKRASAKEQETTLNALGQKRWECFHIEKMPRSLKFFCKRRPKTYLRYIAKLL